MNPGDNVPEPVVILWPGAKTAPPDPQTSYRHVEACMCPYYYTTLHCRQKGLHCISCKEVSMLYHVLSESQMVLPWYHSSVLFHHHDQLKHKEFDKRIIGRKKQLQKDKPQDLSNY